MLVHDSIIFDGVDERQRALALEIAAKEADVRDFQYICTLNSDYIPWSEFSVGFDVKKMIKYHVPPTSLWKAKKAQQCLKRTAYNENT